MDENGNLPAAQIERDAQFAVYQPADSATELLNTVQNPLVQPQDPIPHAFVPNMLPLPIGVPQDELGQDEHSSSSRIVNIRTDEPSTRVEGLGATSQKKTGPPKAFAIDRSQNSMLEHDTYRKTDRIAGYEDRSQDLTTNDMIGIEDQNDQVASEYMKRPRGRPRKSGSKADNKQSPNWGGAARHARNDAEIRKNNDVTVTKRGRGRPPRKSIAMTEADGVSEVQSAGHEERRIEELPAKRGRGRPRKGISLTEVAKHTRLPNVDEEEQDTELPPKKRARGRPRKQDTPVQRQGNSIKLAKEESVTGRADRNIARPNTVTSALLSDLSTGAVKRGPGRPRKSEQPDHGRLPGAAEESTMPILRNHDTSNGESLKAKGQEKHQGHVRLLYAVDVEDAEELVRVFTKRNGKEPLLLGSLSAGNVSTVHQMIEQDRTEAV